MQETTEERGNLQFGSRALCPGQESKPEPAGLVFNISTRHGLALKGGKAEARGTQLEEPVPTWVAGAEAQGEGVGARISMEFQPTFVNTVASSRGAC